MDPAFGQGRGPGGSEGQAGADMGAEMPNVSEGCRACWAVLCNCALHRLFPSFRAAESWFAGDALVVLDFFAFSALAGACGAGRAGLAGRAPGLRRGGLAVVSLGARDALVVVRVLA